jgi:flagellar hook-associated protein 2
MTTSSVSSSGSTSNTSTAGTNTSSSNASNVTAASSSVGQSSTTGNTGLGQQILTSLGAGSGVNVAQLAQSLVNATELPQQQIINSRITSDQSKISGFSAVSYVVQEVQTAMSNLQDQSNFNQLTVSNTGTGTFTISTTPATPVGNHSVTINSLASAQSVLSNAFASSNSPSLNNGNNFSIQILSGTSTVPSVINIPPGSDTPQGIVDAINASANKGSLNAVLVNTGSSGTPYQIQLTGDTGASNNFSVSTDTSNSAPNLTNLPYSADPSSIVLSSASFNVNLALNGGASNLINIPVDSSGSVTVGDAITAINSSISPNYTASIANGQIQITDAKGNLQQASIASYNYDPTLSSSFSSSTASLNNPCPFILAATVNGSSPVTAKIPTGATTADIVNYLQTAINTSGNSAISGDTVKMVNTGSATNPSYQIQIIDATSGSAQAVTFSSYSSTTPPAIAGLSLMQTSVQSASDASLTVDGVNYTRASNTVNDVIAGATISITGKTTSSNPASVTLTRNTQPVLSNIQALVSAYNDSVTMLGAVSNPQSTLATYGATLVGNSTVRLIQSQLQSIITGESSTPGTNVGALWQLGITLTSTGTLSVNTTTLNSALSDNFTDVVKTFTGNLDNSTYYGNSPRGIAGDAVKTLTTMLGSTGPIQTQTNDFNSDITKQQTNLSDLQSRMAALLTQYTNQFAAMDSFVGEINAEKTSLTSSFAGMMAMYTNKN